MDELKPTTSAGRDHVARLLEPVVLEGLEDGTAAADLYVVLATTIGAMRRTMVRRGARYELAFLDDLVDRELATWTAGS